MSAEYQHLTHFKPENIISVENGEQKKRHTLSVAVHLLLIDDNKVLLGRRYNTGYMDGYFAPPAGHLEDYETAKEATSREGLEEIGVYVNNESLNMVHTLHMKSTPQNYVYLFFTANKWEGVPTILEPHRCDSLAWYDLDNLPENIMPVMNLALRNIKNNVQFSEYGWENISSNQ